MKPTRTMAILAATGIAAATAVIGADTASAATSQPLCVNASPVCAGGEGASNSVGMSWTSSPEDWLYNLAGVTPGTIQQAGTTLCMQLDHNAGNIVIEAACNPSASYQKWQRAINGNTGIWEIYSEWNTSLCLTYNESKGILDTVTCNGAWYQAFGSVS